MKTNDDIILELREKIKEKKDKLINVKKFNPLTNCIIELDNKSFNIRAANKENLIMLLVKLNSYKISAVELGLIDECNFSGFNVSEWISDICDRISEIKIKEEKEMLKSMENKLKKLLTNEKQVQLEVEELANLLSDL